MTTILSLVEQSKTNNEIESLWDSLDESTITNTTSWNYIKVEQHVSTSLAESLGNLIQSLAEVPGMPRQKMLGAYAAYMDDRGIRLDSPERQQLVDAAILAGATTSEIGNAIKSLGITRVSYSQSLVDNARKQHAYNLIVSRSNNAVAAASLAFDAGESPASITLAGEEGFE